MRGTWLVIAAVAGLGWSAGSLAGQDHAQQGHEMQAAMPDSSGAERTPLYDNLGSYHMAVTTARRWPSGTSTRASGSPTASTTTRPSSPTAKASARTPTCAMCWWGIAYALGPNINVPMDTGAVRPAWDALQQAVRLAPAGERQRPGLHPGAPGALRRPSRRPIAPRSIPPGPGRSARCRAATPRTTTPPRCTPRR